MMNVGLAVCGLSWYSFSVGCFSSVWKHGGRTLIMTSRDWESGLVNQNVLT